MNYGYARVSTKYQELAPQLRELQESGCEIIRYDKMSGKNADREEFQKLLKRLKSGDTLTVTKLDRFARNLREGIEIIEELLQRGVKVNVLNFGTLDSSPTGKMITSVLLAIAEFEREIMLERQREGIKYAKERGVYRGRIKRYTDNNKALQHALKLFKNRDKNNMTVKEICQITRVGRTTLYNIAREKNLI